MRSVLGRTRGLPPARRLLAFAAVVAVADLLVYAVLLAGMALVGDGPVAWTRPIGPVVGAFVGALLGQSLNVWWQRRRAGEGDRAARRTFETAARTGRLPTVGADPAVWAPQLEHRQQVQRRRTVVAMAVLGVLTVSLVALLPVAEASVLQVVVTALGCGQVMRLVWVAGERRRLAGMLERLAARAPVDQPAGR